VIFDENFWEKNWSTWAKLDKAGQTLENFSQPRDKNIFSNKKVFLKLE
jgi:hypothetical protein